MVTIIYIIESYFLFCLQNKKEIHSNIIITDQDKNNTFKHTRNQEVENTRKENRLRMFEQQRQTQPAHLQKDHEAHLLQQTIKWFQNKYQKQQQLQDKEQALKSFFHDLILIFKDRKQAQTYFNLINIVRSVPKFKQKHPKKLIPRDQPFLNQRNMQFRSQRKRQFRQLFQTIKFKQVTLEMISPLFGLIRNEKYKQDALWLLINSTKAYSSSKWTENRAIQLFLSFITQKKVELIEAVELSVQGLGFLSRQKQVVYKDIIKFGVIEKLLGLYNRINHRDIPQFKNLQFITRQVILECLKAISRNGNELDTKTEIELLKFCLQCRLSINSEKAVLVLLGDSSLEVQRHLNDEVGIDVIIKFLIGDHFWLRTSQANANIQNYFKNLIENCVPQLLYNNLIRHRFINNLETLLSNYFHLGAHRGLFPQAIHRFRYYRLDRDAYLLFIFSIVQDLLTFQQKYREGKQKVMLGQFKRLIGSYAYNQLRNQRSKTARIFNKLIIRFVYIDEDVAIGR